MWSVSKNNYLMRKLVFITFLGFSIVVSIFPTQGIGGGGCSCLFRIDTTSFSVTFHFNQYLKFTIFTCFSNNVNYLILSQSGKFIFAWLEVRIIVPIDHVHSWLGHRLLKLLKWFEDLKNETLTPLTYVQNSTDQRPIQSRKDSAERTQCLRYSLPCWINIWTIC